MLDKDTIGAELTREDMANMWSTKDLLRQNERDLLVWHYRLNHCSLKFLFRLSKRGLIPRKLGKIRKIPPCVACLFVKSHKMPCRTKRKRPGRPTRKPSETRPVAMNSIVHMVYYQPGITPQVIGALTHTRFWEATVLVDHYSK